MRADRLGGGDHLLSRWRRPGRSGCCPSTVAAEQIIHLQHQAHLVMERFAGHVADVVAIDQHAALLRLIEAGDAAR